MPWRAQQKMKNSSTLFIGQDWLYLKFDRRDFDRRDKGCLVSTVLWVRSLKDIIAFFQVAK